MIGPQGIAGPVVEDFDMRSCPSKQQSSKRRARV
jgi:hypothetical protein